MTKEDKIWLCKLAFKLLNYIIYFVVGGTSITYWRSREGDVREEFEALADE